MHCVAVVCDPWQQCVNPAEPLRLLLSLVLLKQADEAEAELQVPARALAAMR
jgi:hypothetical protein